MTARRGGAATALIAALVALVTAITLPSVVVAVASGDSAYPARPQSGWGVNGRVLVTKVVGDVVVVGGNFTKAVAAGGTTVRRANLAVFRLADGRLVQDWRADTDGAVRALAVDGDALLVGGYFGQVEGLARHGLVRLDLETGDVVEEFDARLNHGVQAVVVRDGAVYAGGRFKKVAGESRRFLTKLDPGTGALVEKFDAGVDGPVFAMAAQPNSPRLWIAGAFSRVGGKARVGLAAVRVGRGALTGPRLRDTGAKVRSLDLSNDGRTLAAGDTLNRITAWRTSSGRIRWRHRAGGDIQAVAFARGWVYFGFHEKMGNDRRVKVLAARAGSGRLDSDWRPRIRSYWGVFAIDANRHTLVIGGEFDRVAGVRAKGWTRFR